MGRIRMVYELLERQGEYYTYLHVLLMFASALEVFLLCRLRSRSRLLQGLAVALVGLGGSLWLMAICAQFLVRGGLFHLLTAGVMLTSGWAVMVLVSAPGVRLGRHRALIMAASFVQFTCLAGSGIAQLGHPNVEPWVAPWNAGGCASGAVLLFLLDVCVRREVHAVDFLRHGTSAPVFLSWRTTLALVLLAIAGIGTAAVLSDYKKQEQNREISVRLERYNASLDGWSRGIDRQAESLASRLPVRRFFRQGEGRDGMNRWLEQFCWPIEAAVCYLVGRDGRVAATSNWRDATSLAGLAVAFRPYFREALSGRFSHMLALGVLTERRGYFSSAPVYDEAGTMVGVAVIKRELTAVEMLFSHNDVVFLLSPDGIAFLSSLDSVRLQPLWALSASRIHALNFERQFGVVGGDGLFPARPLEGGRVHFRGTPQLVGRLRTAFPGWDFLMLAPDFTGLFRHFALSVFKCFSLGLLFVAFSRCSAAMSLRELTHVQEERERMQHQLWHSAKLASIGTLAAGIAHEINNPLTIITGNIWRLFAAREPSAAERRQIQEDLTEASRRIAGIVNSLRTFSRSDTDQLTPVNLHLTVEKTVEMLHRLSVFSQLDVILELNASSPFVCGNEGRLRQVLVNLLSNARDALENRSNGQVRISTSDDDGTVLLRVSDNGDGIPEALLPRVFEPFFTTKETGRGMGLGLAIARSIAVSMGGDISVRNAGGAEFTVRLLRGAPVAEAGRAVERMPHGFVASLQGCRALVVEDERSIRELVEFHLCSWGVSSRPCRNAEEALEHLHGCDFILTDLTMPGMDGLALLDHVRSRMNLHTPFILMTGHLLRLERPGIVLLRKPFSEHELLAALADSRKLAGQSV